MTSGDAAIHAQLSLITVLRRRGLSFDDLAVELDGMRCLLGGRDVWDCLDDLLSPDEIRALWPERHSPDPEAALNALLDAVGVLLDSWEMVTDVAQVRVRVACARAAALVEADVAATPGRSVRVELIEHDGWLYVSCLGGSGSMSVSQMDPVDMTVKVAEDVQEIVMEEWWRVWPVCPVHDRGLHPHRDGDAAVWRCRAGAHVVAPIGSLSSVPRRSSASDR